MRCNISGMPMQAHKRIQISLPVSASPYFDSLNNLLVNMPNYTQPEVRPVQLSV